MKKIFLSCALFVFALLSNAQQKGAAIATPTIVKPTVASPVAFNKLKHSFGKIKQGVPKTYTFTLKNNGTKPLIIENATAQCGCTTPVYSKSPILKGKYSPIQVTYNAANPGVFTKTVTVKFLGIDQPTILTIDGEVLKDTEKKE